MAVAAPNKGANAAEISIPANQSLYLQNLPEKLQKHDLKRALYMLFSSYGVVLDVTALKTSKMRGQAHVLFRDVQSATQAMRHCQGYDFFGREMVSPSTQFHNLSDMRAHRLTKIMALFRKSVMLNRGHTLSRSSLERFTTRSNKRLKQFPSWHCNRRSLHYLHPRVRYLVLPVLYLLLPDFRHNPMDCNRLPRSLQRKNSRVPRA